MGEKIFIEKLKKYFSNKKMTQDDVAERLQVSRVRVNNLLNAKRPFGGNVALQWQDAFGIDALWLMTQGEQGTAPDEVAAPTSITIPQSDDIIMIPVINLDVRGGLVFNNETDVAQFVTDMMPFSRSIACEGDVVVPVFGDSMAPRYPSGSHILIRPLPMWREWLELGQSYVLELSDWRRTIKIVRKGATNDTYRLECYNVDYDTTEIPKSLIEHIWQVLMCVKREVM